MGLATSDDLLNWTRHSPEPVMRGNNYDPWADDCGAASGNIVDIPQPDGRTLYRMYHTLLVGTPSEDLLVDQAKLSVCADSWDGIEWHDHKVLLEPRRDCDYEDAATTGLVVWKTSRCWRAIYPAIGTRFGAYSICEAVSEDGLAWHRGQPGENLAMAPEGDGWESKMVTYPNVIAEDGKLRLFYCGNGYGATGIGTALADPIP